MKRILFIGGVYEPDRQNEYVRKSKQGLSNAVNAHQWNLIRTLDLAFPNAVDILSGRFVPEYPSYKDLYIRRSLFSHRCEQSKNSDCNIGFINLFGFKQLHRKLQMKRYTMRWLRRLPAETEIELICYYVNLPFMNAAVRGAQRNKKVKLTLIVPDAPNFLVLSERKTLKQKLTTMFSKSSIFKLVGNFDRYILLTESMREILPIEEKPYLVMEGLVSSEDAVTPDDINQKAFTNKTIVYSGSLHRVYGVAILLEAFHMIEDEEARLIIFGAGELEEEIRQKADLDSRIDFRGFRRREEVLREQRDARILINPRSPQGEFNRYSFPSKNLEYLISGTSVIAARLPGIPDEYEMVMHLLSEINAESLAEAIRENFSKKPKDLRMEALSALNFALKNKSLEIQSQRILEWMNLESEMTVHRDSFEK